MSAILNPSSEELLTLAETLQSKTATKSRPIHLCKYGDGYDECKITATKDGYLALAGWALKAALGGQKPANAMSEASIDVSLMPLLSRQSNIGFNWVERVDSLSDVRDHIEPTQAEKWTAMIILSSLLTVGTLAAIGIYALWSWL